MEEDIWVSKEGGNARVEKYT